MESADIWSPYCPLNNSQQNPQCQHAALDALQLEVAHNRSQTSQESHLFFKSSEMFHKMNGGLSSLEAKIVKRELLKIPQKSRSGYKYIYFLAIACWSKVYRGPFPFIQVDVMTWLRRQLLLHHKSSYYPQQKYGLCPLLNPLQPVLNCDSNIHCVCVSCHCELHFKKWGR